MANTDVMIFPTSAGTPRSTRTEPRPDATDRITGPPLEWRHRLLLWAERFVAPWLLPLVEREP